MTATSKSQAAICGSATAVWSASGMIWTAYIDEADSHGAPVMAMGGFLSLADKWVDFNQQWTDTLLYSHNLSHSHTVDVVHKKNEFRGWENTQHNEFVLGARELMNEHLNAGFVAVLRRDDYHNHYKALSKPRKPPEDNMYGVLLRACVSFSLATVSLQLNENVQGEVANFVLERGGTKPNYARELFNRHSPDSRPVGPDRPLFDIPLQRNSVATTSVRSQTGGMP